MNRILLHYLELLLNFTHTDTKIGNFPTGQHSKVRFRRQENQLNASTMAHINSSNQILLLHTFISNDLNDYILVLNFLKELVSITRNL
ncbi:hypothetical protein AQUCO_02500331v1 [Aquilegia coerulea]|uniref:Uncharacterized protein n=1 Tax=Aquilegia coerulea TaxID=218851 RepID=A0A2G5DAM1_AQUCA|nr:hypothetical protein AQUCO_02500331v1 [Aquilegia coerulea]